MHTLRLILLTALATLVVAAPAAAAPWHSWSIYNGKAAVEGGTGAALGPPDEHRPARLVQGAQASPRRRGSRSAGSAPASPPASSRRSSSTRPRRPRPPSSASSSPAARRTARARAATPSTASRSSGRRAEGHLGPQDADRADVDRRPGDDDAARHVPHRRRPRVARLPARRRVRDDPRLRVLIIAVPGRRRRAGGFGDPRRDLIQFSRSTGMPGGRLRVTDQR